jgi:RNA polymerase sigma-70 factor (ECF subfamily)
LTLERLRGRPHRRPAARKRGNVQGTDSAEIIGLVDRCLTGDRQAQFQLYRRYERAMYNTCLRLMGRPEDAEDMLQEAFLDAFRHLSRYGRQVAFGAWLKRVVVNRCLKQLDRRALPVQELPDGDAERLAGLDDAPAPDAMAHAALSPGGSAVDGYDMARVRRAIEALPDGYRVVFSLYAVEGYDHEEIAQILGVSVSTSKSQYSRARAKVRQLHETLVP